jgi:integrase
MSEPKQRADGTWWFRYSERDPATGKRRQPQMSGFPTKAAAQRALSKKLLELDRRQGRGLERVTVAELLDAWLADRKGQIRETTWIEYERSSRLHIVPHLGNQLAARLTIAQLRAWHAALRAQGLAPASLHRIHGVLNRALRQALRDEQIERNPASDAWPSKVSDVARPYLDADAIQRFLAVSDPVDTYELLFRVALYTGLRSGELLGLQWGAVDLRRGRLKVEQALVDIAGRSWELMPPKTARARRTLSLPGPVRSELAAHRRRQIERRLALGERWSDHGLVFENGFGNPIYRQHAWRRLRQFCEEHGFQPLSMHALRRSHATWLAALGEHPSVVQHRLGHTSSRMTLEIYTQVSTAMDQHAAELLDGAFDWDGDDEGVRGQ